jgi:polyribonucleotide nucleotidyltransferase
MIIKKSIEIDGKILSIETGRFAKQANGAVMVRLGDTMVLVTAVAADTPMEGIDFFPLSVEYRERTSAAGKIPGGFIKREGRPSEKEVLSSRLIDRPIRPMFPDGFRCETQVAATVFSADQEHDADVLAAIGASAALSISDIPFDGPIAEVRVARVDGNFILNPTHKQIADSDMDITVAGSNDSIVMVEGESDEISESEMIEALRFAHEGIKKIVELQNELVRECGKQKRTFEKLVTNEELINDVTAFSEGEISKCVHTVQTKDERKEWSKKIHEDTLKHFEEKFPESEILIKEVLHDIEKRIMRNMIVNENKRLDGRSTSDIRKITCEIGLLPRTHGSSLFTRGETQSLSSVTLGTKMDEQIIDGLMPEQTKRFMLHYNFPPFSTGEVGKMSGTGRREIGHGNLAERSFLSILPDEKNFPYTLRVVSDILESNGSSSMATVCAGTLALMDAGVPIKKPVAGIAMGLIKEKEKIAVLSDILGSEDHFGDMDFKVTGTRNGITAFQMDIKIKGISFEILSEALKKAKEGRFKILSIMEETIASPRADISKYAPRLTTINIKVDQIGTVIGPGGKMIRHIVQESGAEINIEDDGTVVIAAVSMEASQKAQEMINTLFEVPEVGKIYKGKIKRIADFGAFVEILPNKEGLLHISQIDVNRVAKVEDVLNLGDEIEVKVLSIEDDRYALSRKAVLYPDSVDSSRSASPRSHNKKPFQKRNGEHRSKGRWEGK